MDHAHNHLQEAQCGCHPSDWKQWSVSVDMEETHHHLRHTKSGCNCERERILAGWKEWPVEIEIVQMCTQNGRPTKYYLDELACKAGDVENIQKLKDLIEKWTKTTNKVIKNDVTNAKVICPPPYGPTLIPFTASPSTIVINKLIMAMWTGEGTISPVAILSVEFSSIAELQWDQFRLLQN